MRAAIDEELAHLPERYRCVLILCYLEGKTRDEAAQALGCSVGALRGRLERGRDRLRARLIRRGLGLSSVLFASSLARAAGAAVPPTLVVWTVKAASRLAAGQAAAGAIPPRVAALTEGVLKTMLLTKVKKASTALIVSCLLLLATGIMSIGQAGVEEDQGAQATRKPAEGQPPAAAKPEAAEQPGPVERFRQEGDAVAVEFSSDGTVLAAYTCGDRFPRQLLCLYSAITGERLGQVQVSGQGINSRPFAFSPDGKVVAIVDLQGTRLLYCDPASGKTVRTVSLPAPGPVGPILLRFSPDGKRLAVAVTCDTVLMVDSLTGEILQELGGEHNSIFSLAFSPDNRSVAFGTSKPSLQVWDVATGKRDPRVEQKPADWVPASLAYSKDGTVLAAGGRNRITLYDLATGQERCRLEAPMELVNGLAYLPDGNRLVSASRRQGEALVWDLRTGRVLWALAGAAEGRSLAVSPDGRSVALGTADRFIVWDLPFTEDNAHRQEAPSAPRTWNARGRSWPRAHRWPTRPSAPCAPHPRRPSRSCAAISVRLRCQMRTRQRWCAGSSPSWTAICSRSASRQTALWRSSARARSRCCGQPSQPSHRSRCGDASNGFLRG